MGEHGEDRARRIGADIGRRVEVVPDGSYYIVECGWCGVEIHPGGGFRETPRVGRFGFHYSCIEAAESALRTLAFNLAAGAFGCLAFYYGSILDGSQAHWRPGCQRTAPGFDDGKEE